MNLSRGFVLALLGLTAGGCFKTSEVLSSDGSKLGSSGSGAPDSDGGTSGSGSDGGAARALDPDACERGGLCTLVETTNVDRIDLLFAIDDSSTMGEEQVALSAQFPRLIEALTTGDHDGDGTQDFPAARDIHLGVVSGDLGTSGVGGIEGCQGQGDDGVLQREPRLPDCFESYPSFITYVEALTTGTQTARDFACIAALGSDGCRYQQPLEAAIKALWPASDPRVSFLGDANGRGTLGHGEDENHGFLRSDPLFGESVLAVIVVSDDDDCSATETTLFAPNQYLDPTMPSDRELAQQGAGVRCALNQDSLFATTRYVAALEALRPGQRQRVVFGALVGVPPETVDASALAGVDFHDAGSRAAFYSRIDEHDDMKTTVDDRGTLETNDDALRPSCSGPHGSAAPPSRIVEVARGLGADGIVQSICEDDYGPALDVFAERIGAHLGATCLEEELARDDEGLVACDVIWELPLPGFAPVGTPTACEQPGFPFLKPLARNAQQKTAAGGVRCGVVQLPFDQSIGRMGWIVVDGEALDDGWYYDDFSEDVARECRPQHPHRIAFSPSAKPPTGVRVVLDCAPNATR